MDVNIREIGVAIAIGVGATMTMDLWNWFLRRAFGMASLDYCLLGRWVGHLPRGTIVHASIAAAERKANECAIGWIAHYTIGIGLAIAFVMLVSSEWVARPTLLPALLYGVVTVVLPFLVLQPSLGLGVASSKTPSPGQARVKSLVTHAVFGAGLYLFAVAMRHLTPLAR